MDKYEILCLPWLRTHSFHPITRICLELTFQPATGSREKSQKSCDLTAFNSLKQSVPLQMAFVQWAQMAWQAQASRISSFLPCSLVLSFLPSSQKVQAHTLENFPPSYLLLQSPSWWFTAFFLKSVLQFLRDNSATTYQTWEDWIFFGETKII